MELPRMVSISVIKAATKSGKTALLFAVARGSLKAAEVILKHDKEQVKHVDLGLSVHLLKIMTDPINVCSRER